MDEFSEKFQTAFDPPPLLIFRKLYFGFCDKTVQNCDKILYIHYGGTVVYYMIIDPISHEMYHYVSFYC